jgi:uncharacterized membrane protein
MKTIKTILKILFALIFIAAGILHFASSEPFLRIMPPALPFPLLLVYLSGACEIALGVSLLIPKSTRLAAWGLIALLIAVFPANIYMALNTQLFPDIDPLLIYLRLPLQVVLIAWAYWFTKIDS